MAQIRVVACILFTVIFLSAQQSPLGGPVEGFIFDVPTRSFRAIVGSLGSASFGPTLAGGLEFGSVAPGKSYAIAFLEGHCLLLYGLDSSEISRIPVAGVTSVPEGVVWSEDGAVAVLYSRTNNWIQTLRRIPGNPTAGPLLRLAPLGISLLSVAVDMRGEHIAAGVGGESSGIFRLDGDQSLTPLVPVSNPVSLAFSDDGATLYALEGSEGKLWEINMSDVSSNAWLLDGLENASIIRFARDSTRRPVLYTAARLDFLLAAFDLSSHEKMTQIALECQPVTIEPLGAGSFVLGIRTAQDEPLWSFANTPRPRVYFVPAPSLTPEDSAR
jgi:hypothetical protein